MRFYIGMVALFACLVQAGCSMPDFRMPRLHRVTIQQGNVITERMLDELKPGMSRSQVAFIMGEPIFRNTFDDDRWDYLYSVEIPGLYVDRRRLTVYFEDDVVTGFDGDYKPTSITKQEVPAEAIEDVDQD